MHVLSLNVPRLKTDFLVICLDFETAKSSALSIYKIDKALLTLSK